MQLVGRMLATITAILLFSLCVFIGLATLQYNAILSDLTRDRLVVLSNTVRTPFQAVADLGVPIGTMRNADAVLERARASDDSILAIHVFTPDGRIVRSTERRPPAQVEEEIAGIAREAGDAANWHVESAGVFVVGANIAGLTGSPAGAILIRYSKRDANTQVDAMEARLVLFAIAVLTGSLLILFGVLRVVLSEHVRIFDGILASFDTFERGFWRGSVRAPGANAGIEGLGVSTAEFADLMEQSEDQYEMLRRRSASPGEGHQT